MTGGPSAGGVDRQFLWACRLRQVARNSVCDRGAESGSEATGVHCFRSQARPGRRTDEVEYRPGSDYKWALSPDGTRIAVVNRSEGRIHILPLDGKPAWDLTVKGWNSLDHLAWAANGSGFFVSSLVQHGSVLLHVDLRGNSQVLSNQPGRDSDVGRSISRRSPFGD